MSSIESMVNGHKQKIINICTVRTYDRSPLCNDTLMYNTSRAEGLTSYSLKIARTN